VLATPQKFTVLGTELKIGPADVVYITGDSVELGFDMQLLGSERYVKAKLENLTSAQLSLIREAFVKNSHPRFKKEFASSRHQPFGLTSDYIKSIEDSDSAKLAKLIKLVGVLLQTKVYLFWTKP
jgi:hypothetical protein